MPSHIFFRVGRFADSMKANVLAARADEKYLAEVGDDGLYRFGYYPHNVHFLLSSAQMAGSPHTVAAETERLKSILNEDVARQLAWIQPIHAAPLFAHAQYGSPAAILALTNEPTDLAYVEAMRHYARAVAHARNGDASGTRAEIAQMQGNMENDQLDAMEAGGVPARMLIALAGHVAMGKLDHAQGNFDGAVTHYREALELEATVPYTEPPYWYYPVEQSLGAALFEVGDYDGAREAFRAALFKFPGNAWALWGLTQTERALGNDREAAAAEAAFERTWLGSEDVLAMNRL